MKNILFNLAFSLLFLNGAFAQSNPSLVNLSKLTPKQIETMLTTKVTAKTQATSVQCRADSSHTFSWDTLAESWKHSGRQFMTYDLNNNLLTYDGLTWNGSVWSNYSKYSYTYDSYNNRTSKIEQVWNNSSWLNNAKTTWSYDSNNNELSEVTYNWDGTNWLNGSMVSYTYDTNNNLINILFKQWNGTTWVNGDMYSLTYDTNNNRLTSTPDTGNAGFPLTKYEWTYDANNNKTTELRQIWSSAQWNNWDLTTYIYTNNQLTSFSLQHWSSGSWGQPGCPTTFSYNLTNLINVLTQSWNGSLCVNSNLITNTYDLNNNQTSYTNSNWNGSGWSTSYRICASYDANNYKTDSSFLVANTDGSWNQGDSIHYFNCRTITGVKEINDASLNFLVYPNPGLNELNLNLNGLQAQHIKVYSLDGKLLAEVKQFTDVCKIDMSSFSSGSYIIEVKLKDSSQRKRWLKM